MNDHQLGVYRAEIQDNQHASMEQMPRVRRSQTLKNIVTIAGIFVGFAVFAFPSNPFTNPAVILGTIFCGIVVLNNAGAR